MSDAPTVLHKCGAEDGVHPKQLIVVFAAVVTGLAIKPALFEDWLWVHLEGFVLFDTRVKIGLTHERSERSRRAVLEAVARSGAGRIIRDKQREAELRLRSP